MEEEGEMGGARGREEEKRLKMRGIQETAKGMKRSSGGEGRRGAAGAGGQEKPWTRKKRREKERGKKLPRYPASS